MDWHQSRVRLGIARCSLNRKWKHGQNVMLYICFVSILAKWKTVIFYWYCVPESFTVIRINDSYSVHVARSVPIHVMLRVIQSTCITEFVVEPQPTAVILGRDLMLNCSAVYKPDVITTTTSLGQPRGDIVLTYQWEFEGQPVEVIWHAVLTCPMTHKKM